MGTYVLQGTGTCPCKWPEALQCFVPRCASRYGRTQRPKMHDRSSPGVRTWSPTVLLIWPNGAYVPSADGMGGFHHGMNDPCPTSDFWGSHSAKAGLHMSRSGDGGPPNAVTAAGWAALSKQVDP